MSAKLSVQLTLVIFAGLIAGCASKQKTEIMEKAEIVGQPVEPVPAEPTTDYDIRDENNRFVTLVTSLGDMTVELYRDVAPAHADSFFARSAEGFYDGTIFHRIITGFMLQGGDPTGTGTGNAGYYLDAEFNDLRHVKGTLSMARAADPNSASCQFFVCFGPVPQLDGQYTVFGQLVNGREALNQIERVQVTRSPSGEMSKPIEDVALVRAYPSDAYGNPL